MNIELKEDYYFESNGKNIELDEYLNNIDDNIIKSLYISKKIKISMLKAVIT